MNWRPAPRTWASANRARKAGNAVAAFETRSGITATAEHAARELRQAEKPERRDPFDPRDAALKSLQAKRARADGEALLTPPPNLVGERSTEIVPALAADEKPSSPRRCYVDTLEYPNTISIDAAEQRAISTYRPNRRPRPSHS